MSLGARYGWFGVVSIAVIAIYFFFASGTAWHQFKQIPFLDADFASEFAVPTVFAPIVSALFRLWRRGSWRAAIATAVGLGLIAFPLWFVVLICVGCWGVPHCTNAP